MAQLSYNLIHEPTSYIDGSGRTWSFSYNDAGQLQSSTNPLSSQNTSAFYYSGKAIPLGVGTSRTNSFALTVSNSALPGGSKTVNFSVSGTDLNTIASGFAAAIASDSTLSAHGFTATWVGKYPTTSRPAVFVNSSNGIDTTYSISVTGTGSHSASLASGTTGYLSKIDGPLTGSADSSSMLRDSLGRISSLTNSEGYTVSLNYDDMDRVTAISFPDGTQSTTAYDRLNAVVFSDRIGRTSSACFDSMDRLVSVTDPSGRKASFSYCECGALNFVKDGAGNKTSWTRDLLGRTTVKTLADGSNYALSYDD